MMSDITRALAVVALVGAASSQTIKNCNTAPRSGVYKFQESGKTAYCHNGDGGGWHLLLKSNLAGNPNGEFNGEYGTCPGWCRTGLNANDLAAIYDKASTPVEFMVKTNSGRKHVFGPYAPNEGRVTMGGFQRTCTSCNCGGNRIAKGDGGWQEDITHLYWHGGRGGCYGSTHFGFSIHGNVHCDSAKENFGHFHRSGVDTGVYTFGGKNGPGHINEREWAEVFHFYVRVHPTECEDGTFSKTGFSNVDGGCKAHKTCKQAGLFVKTKGTTKKDAVCGSCPVGHKCPADKTEKIKCPAGTFQNVVAQGVCIECGHDSHQGNEGKTVCVGIEEGYYGVGGTETTHTNSEPCPKGYMCPGGAVDKMPCPAGQYQDEEKQSECKICDGYTDEKGQERCKSCSAGFMRNEDGTGQVKCSVGSFCEADPTSESNGYCPAAKLCPAGTVQPEEGQSECHECKPGFFASEPGGAECEPHTECTLGQYVLQAPTITDDRLCKHCPDGQFATELHVEECTACISCGDAEIVTAPCLLTSDRECGKKVELPSPSEVAQPSELMSATSCAALGKGNDCDGAKPSIRTASGDLDLLTPPGKAVKIAGNDVIALIDELQTKAVALESLSQKLLERVEQQSSHFDALLDERDRRIEVLEEIVDEISMNAGNN